jgi:predicted 3-demethylubiquinone-9 3-methyltransferase (glyoxalase superfamily)
MGLNGGPNRTFNESISFVVECDTQEEIDHYHDALAAKAKDCGWVEDKYGVNWQIVPRIMSTILSEGGDKAKRAFGAMMTMQKFDIAAIEAAVRGE